MCCTSDTSASWTRAPALGGRLIVGVLSDALNLAKKSRHAIYPEADRPAMFAALRCVDEVFVEESLDMKGEHLQRHRAAVLVMGDDWQGRFDHFSAICEVVYLPRTPSISTTEIIRRVP